MLPKIIVVHVHNLYADVYLLPYHLCFVLIWTHREQPALSFLIFYHSRETVGRHAGPISQVGLNRVLV